MKIISILLLMTGHVVAALSGSGAAEDPFLLLLPLPDGQIGTGSGFFIAHSNGLFLVTARHVLFNAGVSNTWMLKGETLQAQGYGTNHTKLLTWNLNLRLLEKEKNTFHHETRDVAAIRVIRYLTNGNAVLMTGITEPDDGIRVIPMQHAKLMATAEPGDTCYVLGYPTSVTTKNSSVLNLKRPLVRRALVSDVDPDRRHIVLDCAVYKGNSGGPVMVLDDRFLPPKVELLGLVSAFVPFSEEWRNVEFGFTYVTTSNSGYAIVEPVDFVLELLGKAP